MDNTSDFVTDETAVVIVSLNISETNRTLNGTLPKAFIKRKLFFFFLLKIFIWILGTDDDSSINNIIFGIGVVVVILIFILIIIKLVYKCYKMCREDDEKKDESMFYKRIQISVIYFNHFLVKHPPLIPSPSSGVVRRNSSIRNPGAASHRSSLPVETLMDFQQRRLLNTSIEIPSITYKS